MTGWFRCGRGNEVRGSVSEGGEPLNPDLEPRTRNTFKIFVANPNIICYKRMFISHTSPDSFPGAFAETL